jgi:ankyrin repeat protein
MSAGPFYKLAYEMIDAETAAEAAAILEKVRELGGDVNTIVDPIGHETLLHRAIENPEAVLYLLEQGADPSISDRQGDTPLHEACEEGNVHVIRAILDRRPDLINMPGQGRFTPILLALRRNRIDAAMLLLERGADLNAPAPHGQPPLWYAASMPRRPDLMDAILRAGANPNIQDYEGNTPLHVAVERGNAELVDMLFRAGANPFITNNAGRTPIDAARYRPQEFVEWLNDMVIKFEQKGIRNKGKTLAAAQALESKVSEGPAGIIASYATGLPSKKSVTAMLQQAEQNYRQLTNPLKGVNTSLFEGGKRKGRVAKRKTRTQRKQRQAQKQRKQRKSTRRH